MKAIEFDGEPRVVERAVPIPKPGEASLRVLAAGVCNTDLEIVRGYMGFAGVLGHECVAEVLSHPDEGWVGRRVAVEINLSCGGCDRCRTGLGRHCATRTVLGILGKDGCFAEELTMPVENLHAIPDEVTDDAAVFVEPLAAAFEILEQIRVGPSARVAVLGDGKLGLLVAAVLAETSCELHVVGKHAAKLSHAERLGARTYVAEAPPPAGSFDVVVEATGSESGLDAALALVRPRGRLVLKSTFHGRPTVDTAKIVIDEIAVVGSRCGPFAPAIRALSAGRIDPTPLLSESFSLEQGLRALDRAAERGVLKVTLRP